MVDIAEGNAHAHAETQTNAQPGATQSYVPCIQGHNRELRSQTGSPASTALGEHTNQSSHAPEGRDSIPGSLSTTQMQGSPVTALIERSTCEKRSRQPMGPKGIDITGSGQLPVLDTYLDELVNRKRPSAVTHHLAEALYQHHEPPQLPQRLQSFYLGPQARQPDLYGSTALPPQQRPASASSTLLRLHDPSSTYAHVKSRIWSSANTRERSPAQAAHSQLLHGSESSLAQPQRAPPRVARGPVRAGDPLSKSLAGKMHQQGSVFRSAPTSVPARRGEAAQMWKQKPLAVHAGPYVELPVDPVQYGPTASTPAKLQPLAPNSIKTLQPPPIDTSAINASVPTVPSPSAISLSKGGGAAPTRKHQGHAKVQRFVADLGRVMGQLQPAGAPADVEEGWGPEGPGKQADTLSCTRQWQLRQGAAAAARQQALRVPLYSRVTLPASVQGAASASGKSGVAKVLHDLYEREGHTKTSIRKMLDQLPQLNRLEGSLLQAIADRFKAFSYPPNSLLLAEGTPCTQVLLLLSGQMLVQPRSHSHKHDSTPDTACNPQPVALQPGAVVGVDLMLQRLQVPNDIRCDPHFECHVAALEWEDYEHELCSWSASKVLQHLPGLQFSVEAQLRAAIAQHGTHMHRDAGSPICTEGSHADSVMLVVQGQVLMTKQLEQSKVVTEGQLLHHLRVALGPSQDLVTLHAHTPSRNAARGIKRITTGRSKAFQAALLRRQAMQVSSGDTPTPTRLAGKSGSEPVPEGKEADEQQESGADRPIEEGHASPVDTQPGHEAETSSADTPWETRPGGSSKPQSPQEEPSSEKGPPAHDHAHGQQHEQNSEQHLLHEQPPEQPPPNALEQKQLQPQGAQETSISLPAHPPASLPPHPHTHPYVPALPLHPMSRIRSKLGGPNAATYPSSLPPPYSLQTGGPGIGTGSSCSSKQGPREPAGRAAAGHAANPQHTFLRGGSGGGGGSLQAHQPQPPFVSTLAEAVEGGAPGVINDDGVPAQGPSGLGGGAGAHSAHSLEHLASCDGLHGVHQVVEGSVTGNAAADSAAEGARLAASVNGKAESPPATEGTQQPHTHGTENHHQGPDQGPGSPRAAEPKHITQDASRGKVASTTLGHNTVHSSNAVQGGSAPQSAQCGTPEDEMSEWGVIPEGLKGVPLLNALATMLKTHHQQVEAVYNQPVFMGAESLHSSKDEQMHSKTVISLQSTECILIPSSVLAAILPKASLALLSNRMKSEAQIIATTASGPRQASVIERWPEHAGALREFLQTKPGLRPVWQCENLADGFTSVKALAQLPWQARLRLFQGLKFMVVDQADPALSLAIPCIEEVIRPPPGHLFHASESQLSQGVDADEEVTGQADSAGPGAQASADAPGLEDRDAGEAVQEGASRGDDVGPCRPGGAEGVSCSRALKTTVTCAMRGINASVAEAEAAIARLAHLGRSRDEGEEENTGTAPLPATLETAQRKSSSMHGDARVDGGGAGVAEAEEDEWEEAGSEEASLLRSKSTVETRMQSESRKLRSPDSALRRLMAAAEAAEIAHVDAHGAAAESSKQGNQLDANRRASERSEWTQSGDGEGGGPKRKGRKPCGETGSIEQLQQPQIQGQQQLAGAQVVSKRQKEQVRAGQDTRVKQQQQQQQQHVDAPSPCSECYPSLATEGHNQGKSNSDSWVHPSSSHDLASFKREHGHSRQFLRTPDTEKFGSLSSWDGGSVAHEVQLPRSGPCTPSFTSPPGASTTSDPFPPAAYRPYDMDTQPKAQAQQGPTAAKSMPEPKRRQPSVSAQQQLPKAGAPGPAGVTPLAQAEQAPRPSTKDDQAPASSAALKEDAGLDAASYSGSSTNNTRSSAAQAAAAKIAAAAKADRVNSIAAFVGDMTGMRKKLMVLDPAPDEKDDQHYIIISGSIVLQAQVLPHEDQPQVQGPLLDQAMHLSPVKRRQNSGPAPVVLATLGMGEAFSAKMAVELLTARVAKAAAEAAAAQDAWVSALCIPGSSKHRALLPLPLGPCQIVAVVVSPHVELLGMNAVLFELVVNGAGRAMGKLEVEDVFKQVGPSWLRQLWTRSPSTNKHTGNDSAAVAESTTEEEARASGDAGLTLGQVAKDLSNVCRSEEHKQGVELLRRGEASSCVYVVLSGMCVLRSSYVGLTAESAGHGVLLMDLFKVKAGDTSGELSLIANRPLWYSLVVTSPTARVMAINLEALRAHACKHLSSADLEKILHSVADKDLRLYATAIHTQALLIQQGKLVLDVFVPTVRNLLKQVLILGPIGASGVQGAALETMEAISKGHQQKYLKKAGARKKQAEGEGLVAAAKDVGPIVLEHANEADKLIDHLARPTAISAQLNEQHNVARWGRAQKHKNEHLESMTAGSNVLQYSSFQLSSLLHAAQNPFGSHDELGELAAGCRYEGWSIQQEGHRGPERVVHVCMPTSSLPGDDPFMVRPPCHPRVAHKFERKKGLRAVSGEEVERRWDVPHGQAPSSVLSAEEVMGLTRARVHVKHANLAAALAKSQDADTSDEDTAGTSIMGTTVSQAAGASKQQRGSKALRDRGTGSHFWGEADAGFWKDAKPSGVPEQFVIATEGLGSITGMQEKRWQQAERLCAEETGPPNVLRQSMTRRASMSISRNSGYGGEDCAGDSSRRRISIADHSDPASDRAGKRKPRKRLETRLAAIRSKERSGRALNRRLTEWAWDDSANALEELTARREDEEYDPRSSSSSEYDLIAEAQKLEDARVLELQFSVLGQGKRNLSHSGKSSASHSGKSSVPDLHQQRSQEWLGRESSFGVLRKSEPLANVSEEEEEVCSKAGQDQTALQVHKRDPSTQQQQDREHPLQHNSNSNSAQQQDPQAVSTGDSGPESAQASELARLPTAAQHRESMRRMQSMVSFSVDARKGGPISIPPDHPYYSRALAPPSEALDGHTQEGREDLSSPETQGVPDAILMVLASEPPERESIMIKRTYSMGQAALLAAERVLPGSDQAGPDLAASEPSFLSTATGGHSLHGEHQPGLPSEPTDRSCRLASQECVAAEPNGHPSGAGGQDPHGGGKDVDLRERHFWVRDNLHDPSGITNPSMSLLMGEALAGALGRHHYSSSAGSAMNVTRGPGSTAAGITHTASFHPPTLKADPSTISSYQEASTIYSQLSDPGSSGEGWQDLQGENVPVDWSVRVRLPPPRGSIHSPKMRNLPGADTDDWGVAEDKSKNQNPEKQLLEGLWREHQKAAAEAEKAERKKAIKSAFDITGPVGTATAPLPEVPAEVKEVPSWEKEAEKLKSVEARQAKLKELIKQGSAPKRPAMLFDKPKPKLAPKHTTPKEPTSLSMPPTATGTNVPRKSTRLSGIMRGRETPALAAKGSEQQAPGAKLCEEPDHSQALTLPEHPATATQLQRAALQPFSSTMMAKNWERQRAAAARGSRGPLPMPGRPAHSLDAGDPSSLTPAQQQVHQQCLLMQQEAQGWWDASSHRVHQSWDQSTTHGASLGGTQAVGHGLGVGGAGGHVGALSGARGTSVQGAEQQDAYARAVKCKVEVDVRQLMEEDVAYVTVQVPPRTRTTPHIDFSSPQEQQEHPDQPRMHKRREPHMHMRAMMDKVSGPSGSKRESSNRDRPGYVPTFLRSKRTSLAPETARVKVEHEAWVVPHFSSTAGFEYGLFDVNNEITYFD